MKQYAEQVNKLTNQYNDAIQALEKEYDLELSNTEGWNLFSPNLKSHYSKKYEALQKEYTWKRQQLLDKYKSDHPEWARQRKWWEHAFFIGIILILGCCLGMVPSDDTAPEPVTAPQAVSGSPADTKKYWSAADIPIPFLKDSTQYVSNPDRVLSQNTVDQMNVTLKLLDNKLNIQSVVVVVNHIKDDDPFRMAQDIGNKYGVGRDNRGLVIVVGYQDHSINISPGRALEGDLTDLECNQLEQQYVVPAMRAEMPDSAMLYLTEGLYALMSQKEMPRMSLYESDDEHDEVLEFLGIFILLFIGWCSLYLWLNKKYHWLGLVGAVSLLPNPFSDYSSSDDYDGGSFGGGHSGGGGFSGGSFGGGSFGGGGATSRW